MSQLFLVSADEKSSALSLVGEQLLTKEGRETHIFFRREECENTVFYLIFRSQTE